MTILLILLILALAFGGGIFWSPWAFLLLLLLIWVAVG